MLNRISSDFGDQVARIVEDCSDSLDPHDTRSWRDRVPRNARHLHAGRRHQLDALRGARRRPQFEGSAIDQRSATLYTTQEDIGLWRIPLPFDSGKPVLIDTVAEFGQQALFDEQSEECVPVEDSEGIGGPNLVADAEGVDIYYGPGATGYVLVSSQGDDRFAVYTTNGRNRSLGTVQVLGVGVDDINGSDGLAVTNRVVGDYVEGLLVSHDEPETGDAVDPDRDPTNFSYVDWGEIADALHLKVSTKPGNDPRFAERWHDGKPMHRHD